MTDPRPVLIYRSTCAKCRRLSRAVVILTLGRVRRIPLASLEAAALYQRHGVRPGKLALAKGGRMFTGLNVFRGLLPGALSPT